MHTIAGMMGAVSRLASFHFNCVCVLVCWFVPFVIKFSFSFSLFIKLTLSHWNMLHDTLHFSTMTMTMPVDDVNSAVPLYCYLLLNYL